jgi:hypothetical protein
MPPNLELQACLFASMRWFWQSTLLAGRLVRGLVLNRAVVRLERGMQIEAGSTSECGVLAHC